MHSSLIASVAGGSSISGLTTTDPLLRSYHYLYQLQECGLELPFLLPPTFCIEHHAPRAGYVLERHSVVEPTSSTLPRRDGGTPPSSSIAAPGTARIAPKCDPTTFGTPAHRNTKPQSPVRAGPGGSIAFGAVPAVPPSGATMSRAMPLIRPASPLTDATTTESPTRRDDFRFAAVPSAFASRTPLNASMTSTAAPTKGDQDDDGGTMQDADGEGDDGDKLFASLARVSMTPSQLEATGVFHAISGAPKPRRADDIPDDLAGRIAIAQILLRAEDAAADAATAFERHRRGESQMKMRSDDFTNTKNPSVPVSTGRNRNQAEDETTPPLVPLPFITSGMFPAQPSAGRGALRLMRRQARRCNVGALMREAAEGVVVARADADSMVHVDRAAMEAAVTQVTQPGRIFAQIIRRVGKVEEAVHVRGDELSEEFPVDSQRDDDENHESLAGTLRSVAEAPRSPLARSLRSTSPRGATWAASDYDGSASRTQNAPPKARSPPATAAVKRGSQSESISKDAFDSIRVDYVDADGLRAALMQAPERCVVSAFLLPDDSAPPFDDLFRVQYTPTLFVLERHCGRLRVDDATVPLQARGAVDRLPFGRPVPYSPKLTKLIRASVQRFVWAIEMFERRRVLDLALVVKFRRGALWFVCAHKLRLEGAVLHSDGEVTFADTRVEPPGHAMRRMNPLVAEIHRQRAKFVETQHSASSSRVPFTPGALENRRGLSPHETRTPPAAAADLDMSATYVSADMHTMSTPAAGALSSGGGCGGRSAISAAEEEEDVAQLRLLVGDPEIEGELRADRAASALSRRRLMTPTGSARGHARAQDDFAPTRAQTEKLSARYAAAAEHRPLLSLSSARGGVADPAAALEHRTSIAAYADRLPPRPASAAPTSSRFGGIGDRRGSSAHFISPSQTMSPSSLPSVADSASGTDHDDFTLRGPLPGGMLSPSGEKFDPQFVDHVRRRLKLVTDEDLADAVARAELQCAKAMAQVASPVRRDKGGIRHAAAGRTASAVDWGKVRKQVARAVSRQQQQPPCPVSRMMELGSATSPVPRSRPPTAPGARSVSSACVDPRRQGRERSPLSVAHLSSTHAVPRDCPSVASSSHLRSRSALSSSSRAAATVGAAVPAAGGFQLAQVDAELRADRAHIQRVRAELAMDEADPLLFAATRCGKLTR